VKVKETDKNE